MRKGMFCPSCGSSRGPFFKGFCRKCFLSQKQLVFLPEEIKIEHCKSCNRIRLGGKWVEQTDSALKEFLTKKVKVKELQNPVFFVELEPAEKKSFATVNVTGSLDKNKISVTTKAVLLPAETQCDDCMKLVSAYFEATIQIRLTGKQVSKKKHTILSEIEAFLKPLKAKDMLASIVKMENRKNGFDAVIASNRAALNLVKALSAKHSAPIKKSFKVTGRDKRDRVKKRFTYCLRF